MNLENGGASTTTTMAGTVVASASTTTGRPVASRESVSERRRSSVSQDLTEYTYSVAEEPDTEVADDDDVFEMEASGGGEQIPPGNGATGGGGGAVSEAKRRSQSLGSLTGEPKSPRKVLNAAYVNNLKLHLFFDSFFLSFTDSSFSFSFSFPVFFVVTSSAPSSFLARSPPFSSFHKLLINIDPMALSYTQHFILPMPYPALSG